MNREFHLRKEKIAAILRQVPQALNQARALASPIGNEHEYAHCSQSAQAEFTQSDGTQVLPH